MAYFLEKKGKKMKNVSHDKIKITDGFWRFYADLDRKYLARLIGELEKENPAFGQFTAGALALMKDANNKGVHVYGQEKLEDTTALTLAAL